MSLSKYINIDLKELENYLPNFKELTQIDKKKAFYILLPTLGLVFFTSSFLNWFKAKRYFKKLNVPGPAPLPFIGNLNLVAQKGIVGADLYLVEKYGKTVGVFEVAEPVTITADPDFIKKVMVKDFPNFMNRRILATVKIDPFDKFLMSLKDEEWKNMRTFLTKTFTTGKLKAMSKCIVDCANNLDEYFANLVDSSSDGIFDVGAKFGSYAVDSITSCGFGIDVNSISEDNNIIVKQLDSIFNFDPFKNPKLLMFFFFPRFSGYLLSKKLITALPYEPIKFLTEFSNQIVEKRRKKLQVRDDFIQYMVDSEENSESKSPSKDKYEKIIEENNVLWLSNKRTLTNKEILANSLLFFIAGKETTATTLSFIAHNLALYPECQEKLCKEIDDILDKHNGQLNYDTISSTPYMNMVIDETLRMYPAAPKVDRIALEDYKYKGIKLPKGSVWSASIWALHHDPEIYPNPFVFDPERFNEQNSRSRHTHAFIPFGSGPRMCIGIRFAIIEIKFALFAVYSKYRLVKCDKTIENIEIDNSGFCKPKNPIYLKAEHR